MTLRMPMVKIRLKCPDVESFVEKYQADVNIGGMFVRTRAPLAAGTAVSFDVRLADNSCLFRGAGVVIWSRADETLAPLLDPGMMLGFDELRDGTREIFERVLARKRTMEEAADTVPTLVRTFAGDPAPLPMTTEMTADEIEALRSRVRTEMAADGDAPAPPIELAVETAAPRPVASPTTVPSEPRLDVEARPLSSQAVRTPLAKLLVLRAQPVAGDAAVDPSDLTPLPPVVRYPDVIEEAPSSPAPSLPSSSPSSASYVDITGLIGSPAGANHATRLLALAVFGWTLLFTAVVLNRLNVVQRMLEWLNGA